MVDGTFSTLDFCPEQFVTVLMISPRLRPITILVLLVVVGCAAEKRTIFFLPVDPVLIVPRQGSLVRIADVRIADLREEPEVRVVRVKRSEAELAMYPSAQALVEEIVATVADQVLASEGTTSKDFILECDILRFDVATQKDGRSTELIVFVELALRAENFQKRVSGASERIFNRPLVRKDFQDVVHTALLELADDIGTAMKELGSGTIGT